MSIIEAKEFIETKAVQSGILHYTTIAFDHILVHFASQPELGYLRVSTPEEVNELALTDFFELFYTDDETFSRLYPKQFLHGEASLSKHFRSAIGFIVVSAVEDYMGGDENYLWNNEPDLYEVCLDVAAKRYFELMSYNDMYTMARDYPNRMLKILQFLKNN